MGGVAVAEDSLQIERIVGADVQQRLPEFVHALIPTLNGGSLALLLASFEDPSQDVRLYMVEGPLVHTYGVCGLAVVRAERREKAVAWVATLWGSRAEVEDELLRYIEADWAGFGVAWIGPSESPIAQRNGYRPSLVEYVKET